LITFIPKEVEKDYGNAEPHYYINSYSKYAMGGIYDLPLSVPTTQMTQNVYMMQNYGRAATAFYLLNEMLGEVIFKKAILEFINNWAGKHPTPTDLFYTFNTVANEDLSWFWQPWFYEFGYADLSLENVIIKNNKLKFNVINKGNFPTPIRITIFFTDKTSEVIYENVRIWKNTNSFTFEKKYSKTIEKIILGDENIPDCFIKNNFFEN
jgi:aminopeptidase N